MKDSYRTDEEFVSLCFPELDERYKYTKGIVSLAPKQCLSEIRSFLHKIVGDIYSLSGMNYDGQKLGHAIDYLKRNKFINNSVSDKLFRLKKSGDKAVHPEDYPDISNDQYKEMAQASLRDFCELLAVYRLSCFGIKDNNYLYVDNDKFAIKEVTYKAIFESDSESQYRTAVSLLEYEIERINEEAEEGSFYFIKSRNNKIIIELIYSAAQYRHPQAMLKCALLFLYGVNELGIKPEGNTGQAMTFMKMAAEDIVEAKSQYAIEILENKRYGELDDELINEALSYLHEAAEKEDPRALHYLATYYLAGGFVDRDICKAEGYLEKAVNLGFPYSQLLLGNTYEDSGKVDDAARFYGLAAEQGVANASLCKARMLRRIKRYNESKYEYMRYFDLEKNFRNDECCFAKVEFGELLINLSEGDFKVAKEGLTYLIDAINHNSSNSVLRQKADIVALKGLKKIESFFSREVYDDNFVTFLLHFKKNGSIRSQEEVFELIRGVREVGRANIMELDFYVPKRMNVSSPVKMKMGRNEKCHCGSGKKYKNCHGL